MLKKKALKMQEKTVREKDKTFSLILGDDNNVI